MSVPVNAAIQINTEKHTLGRLLAAENIRIEHQKIPGPYFDTKNRVLALPIWENMDADLYDLMIGHEVGHALYTPSEGWEAKVRAKGRGYKGFLNVVEDIRIEKKMKRKFPGLRRPMYAGYTQLVERGFFRIRVEQMHTLPFADRVNVYYKLGARVGLTFSAEEQKILDLFDAMETWEDVEAATEVLWNFCEADRNNVGDENLTGFGFPEGAGDGDEDFSDEVGGASGGESTEDDGQKSDRPRESAKMPSKPSQTGGNPSEDAADSEDSENDESNGGKAKKNTDEQEATEALEEWKNADENFLITQENFEESLDTLINPDSLPYIYVRWGKHDLDRYVIPAKITHELMQYSDHVENSRTSVYSAYMATNKKYIDSMVKEFELRRNAKQFAKAKISKTGTLDMQKVWRYRLSDDLFLQSTIVPNGKNHGMLMVVDFSSSMTSSMKGTVEQMVSMALFCRKVKIPFEVYGFFDNGSYRLEMEHAGRGGMIETTLEYASSKKGELHAVAGSFRMKQLLHDRMRAPEFKQAVSNLLLFASMYNRNTRYSPWNSSPASMQLGGTPLIESVMVLKDIALRFKERTGVEILNTLILTDGDATGRGVYVTETGQLQSLGYGTNTVIEDNTGGVRKSVTVYAGGYGSKEDPNKTTDITKGLLKLYSKITGSRVFGFYLTSGRNPRRDIMYRVGYHFRSDLPSGDFEARFKEFQKYQFFTHNTFGYDAYYILHGSNMEIDDVDMDDVLRTKTVIGGGAHKKTDLARAFKKMQTTKQVSRIFVNRFIQHIS